jgi:hypothetical protein
MRLSHGRPSSHRPCPRLSIHPRPSTWQPYFRFTVGIFILWKFEDAKKKQEWQYQCQCFVPPPLQKMFSLCYVGPLPLRFFPQVPCMPHTMNLKKLRFMHFNKVTQTGVKGCWPCRPWSKKTLSSSFKCYNLKIYAVKKSKRIPHIPILISGHILQLKFLKKKCFCMALYRSAWG